MNKKNEKTEKKTEIQKPETKKISSFKKKKKSKECYIRHSLCLFNI